MHDSVLISPKLFVSSIRAARFMTDGLESNHGIVVSKSDDEPTAQALALVEAGSQWPRYEGWRCHQVVTHSVSVETVIESLHGCLFATSIEAVRLKSVRPVIADHFGAIFLLAAQEEESAIYLAEYQAKKMWPEEKGWASHNARALRLSEDHIQTVLGEAN